MTRVLLIGQDRTTTQGFVLRCLDRGVAVVIAESVCEGVRILAATPVSLLVVDLGGLRLAVSEQAALFERVAPGVPVVVTVGPGVALETRVALELAGFTVVASPWESEDLLKALPAA
jgi:hypothetical protein